MGSQFEVRLLEQLFPTEVPATFFYRMQYNYQHNARPETNTHTHTHTHTCV